MKRKILGILFILAPLLNYAIGIPEENKNLINSITLTGIAIVLLSLTVVSIIVALMSKLIHLSSQPKKKKPVVSQTDPIQAHDEDIIAIATALHLEMRSYQEEQKAILTIQKVIKPFSGWNNKAFGMRNI
jgi:Na+-transporting methylmalonyl-CoA/oxaloacetate decarboxylase gamma subunit